MRIIIDERERDIFNKMSELSMRSAKNTFFVIRETLDIGDIILSTSPPNAEEFCIIERKTFKDLLASIKDGRYEEQSHRLAYASKCPNCRIIYIIEGTIADINGTAEWKTACSAITSLSLYKGFSVLRTADARETSLLLWFMMEKIVTNKGKNKPFFDEIVDASGNNIKEAPSNYCNVVKRVKKDNITQDNIGEILLSQIPGVSSVSAMAIMEHFSSFYNLIESLQKDPTCLDAITTTKNNKTRKMSKKIIETIRHYLLYNKTDNTTQVQY